MSIGGVPVNSTKAGALEIKLQGYSNNITGGAGEAIFQPQTPPPGAQFGGYGFGGITSYWPGSGEQFPPPDEPTYPDPIYTDLWYKFSVGSSAFGGAGFRGMLGLTVWNAGGNGTVNVPPWNTQINPGYNYASTLTVYDDADNVVVTGKRVQFFAGNYQNYNIKTYYIKITTPIRTDIPQNRVQILLVPYGRTQFSGAPFRIGSIMVQNDDPYRPIAALSTVNENPWVRDFVGIPSDQYSGTGAVIPDSFSTFGGGAGDILPNGVTCIMNVVKNGFSIWEKYYISRAPIVIPATNIYVIRRNGDGTNFWVAYDEGTVHKVRSVAQDGTLGTPIGLPAGVKVSRLCARGNEVLYYNLEGEYSVKRWNLITNSALPDLVPAPSPSVGFVNDVMVLINGDVLISYTDPTAITARRVDGITGALKMEYRFTTVDVLGIRCTYSHDPTQFWMRTHEKNGESTYRCIRMIDGIVISTTKSKDFIGGILIDDTILYNADGTPYNHPQFFGGSGRWNFWISPVSGVPVTGPPLDDEMGPPILFPPYPFPPPETPPGGSGTPDPIPPIQIGGGLVILDPDNITRFDSYLDSAGNLVKSTIVSTIRLAFLGD